MRGIRQQAFLTITIVTFLTLGLGMVGWFGLQLTSETITDFEARNLPEISTALSLSESVAQLAALAPYVAGSAKPFQLQSERNRLETRFQDLEAVAERLKDLEFRTALFKRLKILRGSLDELIGHVQDELFLREDLLATRFILSNLKRRQSVLGSTSLDVFTLIEFLLDQTDRPLESQHQLMAMAEEQLSPDVANSPGYKPIHDLILQVLETRRQMKTIAERKSFLLASVRAQSEQLTDQVRVFVGSLQQEVVAQRQRAQSTVEQARAWMLVTAGLLLLGMFQHYRSNFRMTRDLALVTHDMSRLAEGDTQNNPIPLQRRDEIGELAKAHHVFRQHALAIQEFSNDLSQQKELLETIFQHMINGISVFSSNGQLLWWNRRYLEIFNLSESQVHQTQSLEALQTWIDQEPHKDRTLNAHNTSQIFERHYQSGKVVEFRSQPMPDGGFVTLYSDVTARKAVESQLHQAQKMEMLGQLTGGVAHDFNNLLGAILGNLQLLSMSEGLTEKQQRYADRALNVSERGANLIQRLLAFSRKQQLHPEPLLVDDLLEGMMDLVEYSVASNIQISTDLQAQELVFVDPSQLENALLNLAINSSAAMPDGGQLLFSTCIQQMPQSDEPCVALIVKDSGEGIPPELQERVLEPFFTTKAVGQGSGMGLSMVYGFVKQSGGEMQIESTALAGTQITLLLPLGKSDDPTTSKADEAFPGPVQIRPDQKILLVEDDEHVRRAVHEQIESLGFSVVSVENAEAALQHLEANPSLYALVFTDISLTGALSGVDLKAQLKKDWPKLPVLLTSGMPRASLEQHYKLLPDDPLVAKPVALNTLKKLFFS